MMQISESTGSSIQFHHLCTISPDTAIEPQIHQGMVQHKHNFSIYESSQKNTRKKHHISRKVVSPSQISPAELPLLPPRIIKHSTSRNSNLSLCIQPHHLLRTTPPTPAPPTTDRGISIVIAARLAARANGNRDALHGAAVFVATRIHAVVDGEIAADQVCAHGGVFARQCFGFVDGIRLVFAVVDSRYACVPCCCGVGFVGWFWPATAATEACLVC